MLGGGAALNAAAEHEGIGDARVCHQPPLASCQLLLAQTGPLGQCRPQHEPCDALGCPLVRLGVGKQSKGESAAAAGSAVVKCRLLWLEAYDQQQRHVQLAQRQQRRVKRGSDSVGQDGQRRRGGSGKQREAEEAVAHAAVQAAAASRGLMARRLLGTQREAQVLVHELAERTRRRAALLAVALDEHAERPALPSAEDDRHVHGQRRR